MTENKRFTYRFNKENDGEFEIIDFDDDAYYGMDTTENCVRELVKLLNELHEENQSKEKVLHLSANKIETLLEENEKLKKENKSLIQGIKDTAKQGADTITAVWESKNRPTTMNKGYYDR